MGRSPHLPDRCGHAGVIWRAASGVAHRPSRNARRTGPSTPLQSRARGLRLRASGLRQEQPRSASFAVRAGLLHLSISGRFRGEFPGKRPLRRLLCKLAFLVGRLARRKQDRLLSRLLSLRYLARRKSLLLHSVEALQDVGGLGVCEEPAAAADYSLPLQADLHHGPVGPFSYFISSGSAFQIAFTTSPE